MTRKGIHRKGGGAYDGLRNRNGSPWYPRTADRVRRLCCRAAYLSGQKVRKCPPCLPTGWAVPIRAINPM